MWSNTHRVSYYFFQLPFQYRNIFILFQKNPFLHFDDQSGKDSFSLFFLSSPPRQGALVSPCFSLLAVSRTNQPLLDERMNISRVRFQPTIHLPAHLLLLLCSPPLPPPVRCTLAGKTIPIGNERLRSRFHDFSKTANVYPVEWYFYWCNLTNYTLKVFLFLKFYIISHGINY